MIFWLIRVIILFLIIYAVIKNLKTLLKAGIVLLIIFILLGFLGY
ncbi:hypothetical protein [uncultured Methanobrevibacter sp.]|nr:hypothetical protein [uncultured Methanobrevibacter sp.]